MMNIDSNRQDPPPQHKNQRKPSTSTSPTNGGSSSSVQPPTSAASAASSNAAPLGTAGGSAAVMARLDAYLPTLNTGMMDVRVQEAILNYPIVRSLLVPECDMEARRRCINLITKVLNAATPVLPLILQEQRHNNNNSNNNKPPIPVLSQEAQEKVMSILSTMAERDRLIRFWTNHHIQHKGKTTTTNSDEGQQEVHPTIALYTKIKQSKEILSDLADRVQGAICIVFWQCWDEIYSTLAEIVGGDEMQQADTGRIFRPSGEAAMYINRLKMEKRQKLERERRESIISSTTAHYQPQPQIWDPIIENTTAPVIADTSPSVTSDSPGSLATDSTISSSHSWMRPQHTQLPPSHNFMSATSGGFHTQDIPPFDDKHALDQQLGGDGSGNGATAKENNPSQWPLIDNNDMDFVMDDIYSESQSAKDGFETFTNLDSNMMDQDQPKGQQQRPPLDLRKRIQMMEEGMIPDDKPSSHSGIVW